MKVSELLADIEYEVSAEGDKGLETEVEQIILDSRKAEPGCLFVCIKGAAADGHRFAPDVAAVIFLKFKSSNPVSSNPVIWMIKSVSPHC